MIHREEPDLSTFPLDKCEAICQRTIGEIHIEGLITIIGRFVGLNFPAPDYLPVDHYQPNFLLDCFSLERAEMLESRGNDSYSWLDSNKHPVYILPSWVSDSFAYDDLDTWVPPDQLTPAGALLDSENAEDDEEVPEAEDHFDQPPMQQLMYQHDHFQAPPQQFEQHQY